MLRINPLIPFGGCLIFIGLLGPWFNFDVPTKHGETAYVNAMAHISMSPFNLAMNITSTSESSVYVDVDVLYSESTSFYSPKSSAVGLLCILGVVLGFVGEYVNRSKLIVAAGLLVLLPTLLFISFLPTSISASNVKLSVMWGFWLSLLGSALIFLSLGLREIISVPR